MRELRADFTEVWVPTAVVPLVGFADRVCAIASTGLDSVGIPGRGPASSLLDRLQSFDSIVSWYGSNRPEFVEACHGLGLNISFRTAIPSGDRHAVDFFLGRESNLYPRVEAEAMESDPFIAIHPFSGSTHKNWPLDRYQSLAAQLALPVRFCAGPEQTLAGAVQYASLYDLARWIRGASLYIGNDSGITHLAAATGTPTIALFGYSNARVWAPRGAHVRLVGATSMDGIAVGTVLRAAADSLSR